MSVPPSERRQIENEMIFRRANEKVSDALDQLNADHIKEDQPELVRSEDLTLHFKCECSDEDCEVRIPITLSEYQRIHKNRDAFIIKPKHQVTEIETVIADEANYNVVEKNNSVAEPGNKLNTTEVSNVE